MCAYVYMIYVYICIYAYVYISCLWCIWWCMYNLPQKVGEKFTKLSKIGFSMKCFTSDFLRFFTKKRQNLAFEWTAGYWPSNLSISDIFLKFPKSQLVRQLVPFCWWWREIVLKSEKVYKCFVHNCIIYLICMKHMIYIMFNLSSIALCVVILLCFFYLTLFLFKRSFW